MFYFSYTDLNRRQEKAVWDKMPAVGYYILFLKGIKTHETI